MAHEFLQDDSLPPQHKEQIFDFFMNCSMSAFFILQGRRILYANEAFSVLLGRPLELIHRMDIFEAVHPDDRDFVIQRTREVLSGAPYTGSVRFRIVNPERGVLWLLSFAQAVEFQGKKVMAGNMMDITQQVKNEEALRESENNYKQLVENSGDTIFVFQKGYTRYASPKGIPEYGYTEEDLLSELFTDFIHPDDRQMALDYYSKRIRGMPVPEVYSIRLIDKAGDTRWAELRSGRIIWKGKPAVLVFLRDITERKEAEEALRDRERFISTLLGNLDGVVYRCKNDRNRTMLFCSDGVSALTGYNPEELVGNEKVSFGKLIHPKDRRRVQQKVRDALGGKGPFELLYRIRTKDGYWKWVGEKGKAVESGDGKTEFLECFLTDVTLLREYEKALEKRNAFFEAIFHGSPEAVALEDKSGSVIEINKAFERLFQYDMKSAAGRSIWDLIAPPDRRQEVVKNVQRVISGEVVQTRSPRRRMDGSTVEVEITGFPIWVKGEVVGCYGIFRDLTEQKELENQLLQSQKMEAIGRLAGGIAHDFNNMLTVILGRAELVLMQTQKESTIWSSLSDIRDAARRASALTRAILAFSRKQHMQVIPMNLNHLLKGMRQMLEPLIGEDIQIRMKLDPHIELIKADESQLHQVVMNLAVNARDAMPRGGVLTFETKNVNLDHGDTNKIHVDLEPGPYVRLVVRDTGVGMTDEVRSRIFEPFFTTKEEGKGSGLGLSTVYGIVRQSKGGITAESFPGKGSVFTIYLPASHENDLPEGGHEPVSRSAGAEGAGHGSATILVAEDDDRVRGLAQIFLERSGYSVVPARDGFEALWKLKELGTRVDLLLTDIVMPKMSGWELARHATDLFPSIKVLYMTGYDNGIVRGERMPDARILEKPFGAEELLEKIGEVLDA